MEERSWMIWNYKQTHTTQCQISILEHSDTLLVIIGQAGPVDGVHVTQVLILGYQDVAIFHTFEGGQPQGCNGGVINLQGQQRAARGRMTQWAMHMQHSHSSTGGATGRPSSMSLQSKWPFVPAGFCVCCMGQSKVMGPISSQSLDMGLNHMIVFGLLYRATCTSNTWSKAENWMPVLYWLLINANFNDFPKYLNWLGFDDSTHR